MIVNCDQLPIGFCLTENGFETLRKISRSILEWHDDTDIWTFHGTKLSFLQEFKILGIFRIEYEFKSLMLMKLVGFIAFILFSAFGIAQDLYLKKDQGKFGEIMI